MFKQDNSKYYVITYLLVVSLLLPSMVQFTHIFEDHEHNFCGNVSTHLHEEQFDCDLTKIFAPLAQFELNQYTELIDFQIPTLINYTYEQPFARQLSQSYEVRGPPHI